MLSAIRYFQPPSVITGKQACASLIRGTAANSLALPPLPEQDIPLQINSHSLNYPVLSPMY